VLDGEAIVRGRRTFRFQRSAFEQARP
jgi:hypothetical protein